MISNMMSAFIGVGFGVVIGCIWCSSYYKDKVETKKVDNFNELVNLRSG